MARCIAAGVALILTCVALSAYTNGSGRSAPTHQAKGVLAVSLWPCLPVGPYPRAMTVFLKDRQGREQMVRTVGHYGARINLEPGVYKIWATPNVPPNWERVQVRSLQVTRVTIGCPGIQ
jgi:hypothetical protein